VKCLFKLVNFSKSYTRKEKKVFFLNTVYIAICILRDAVHRPALCFFCDFWL